MGLIGRQQQQVSLRLSAPSVEDAVATMRARRDQARHRGLRLKVKDDGRFIARIPGDRSSSPPCLKGRFEPRNGSAVFHGVIFESHANAGIPRGFTVMGIVIAVVAILLAVAGRPSPGSYICGVIAVLFLLIGYGLGHFRKSSFSYDGKDLMHRLTPLLPGAKPLDEDADVLRRHLP